MDLYNYKELERYKQISGVSYESMAKDMGVSIYSAQGVAKGRSKNIGHVMKFVEVLNKHLDKKIDFKDFIL